MKRPVSVLIISWFAIFFGAFSLFPLALVLSSGNIYDMMRAFFEATTPESLIILPFEGYLLFGVAGSFVSMIAGIYMLKRRNWARLLLLASWAAGLTLVLNFYGFSFILILNLLVFLLVYYLLTRKACLIYFRAL